MTAVPPWIVIGLGNPGPQYEGTRHNIGEMAVQLFAEQHQIRLKAPRLLQRNKMNATIGSGQLGSEPIVCAVPGSYMNLSGGPVSQVLRYYSATAQRLIVLHDDLDLPLETVRLKYGGGDGGHNGLKSIRQALGSGDYFRIRIGIGRPPGQQPAADYVLRRFGRAEQSRVTDALIRAAQALDLLITQGLELAQQHIHTAPR